MAHSGLCQKMTLKNAVSVYLGGRKKLNDRFSQFNSIADTAALPNTAEQWTIEGKQSNKATILFLLKEANK